MEEIMECSCEINGCCDESYEDCEDKIITHNNTAVIIKCGECGKIIPLGSEYEWYSGEYDGEYYVHYTCMNCLSLRNNFFGDWTFGRLWDDFFDYMDDCRWEVPEKCLSKVTPKTRAKICEIIEKQWNY